MDAGSRTQRALSSFAIITLLATSLTLAGSLSPRGSVALGASTTVSILRGEVAVSGADGAFRQVASGTDLGAGSVVRTGANTYAVLTYFEGSTVSLEPETTLVIEELGAHPDGSTVISMTQAVGRTWHAVAGLVRPLSKYEVRTPTATATVRGTRFGVEVVADPSGEIVSTVATSEGAVATTKLPTPAEPMPQEVMVRSGSQVEVRQSAPIEQPRPMPQPARTVTVALGAAAGLVLDPIGRANGINVKDGTVIVQTPGASVDVRSGTLVVTLPNIPDGQVAAVFESGADAGGLVPVTTTISEAGRPEVQTTDIVTAPSPHEAAVVAVEVRDGRVVVARITHEERRQIAASVKVAEPPKAVAKAERDAAKVDRDAAKARGEDKARSAAADGTAGGKLAAPLISTLPPIPAAAGDAGVAGATPAPRSEPDTKVKAREAARPEPTPPSALVPRFELPTIPPGDRGAKTPDPDVKVKARETATPEPTPPSALVPRMELPRIPLLGGAGAAGSPSPVPSPTTPAPSPDVTPVPVVQPTETMGPARTPNPGGNIPGPRTDRVPEPTARPLPTPSPTSEASAAPSPTPEPAATAKPTRTANPGGNVPGSRSSANRPR